MSALNCLTRLDRTGRLLLTFFKSCGAAQWVLKLNEMTECKCEIKKLTECFCIDLKRLCYRLKTALQGQAFEKMVELERPSKRNEALRREENQTVQEKKSPAQNLRFGRFNHVQMK
ncbi:hypothetical protein PHMEG_0008049 [Phytophthora megakarya]|uniref:Uncharacterized protein n=1 Tax=Phytophthora megakarya TaxID=4795 RepID=A0A225WLE0_9STRA|nr:hypothetical protein PHMEG_0008049 [Phytophthora megakarya]